MARAKRKGRKHVSTAPMPFGGDHGTGTSAALAGTVLEALTDEKGSNPNNIGRRRRRLQSHYWRDKLSTRQLQAAQAIEDAYAAVQALGSGGDSIGRMVDLQTSVQASPKPDQAIDVHTAKVSRLVHVMGGVPRDMRGIIEHMFWHGNSMTSYPDQTFAQGGNMKVALDLVANKLRY